MAGATLLLLLLSAQLFAASVAGTTTQSPPSAGTCTSDCTCSGESDGEDDSFTRQEGLAAAVGALSPIMLGGAGLGLYHLLKGMGTPSIPDGPSLPDVGSPRPGLSKRGSMASFKDSPPSYHGMRRGSTPVSLFSEDDDLSFDGDGWRSPSRPDSTPSITNIHRSKPGDVVNRWM